jgi:hypothetical protein
LAPFNNGIRTFGPIDLANDFASSISDAQAADGWPSVPENLGFGELTSGRRDWQRYAAQLSEVRTETDWLLAELRHALREVDHWRTLAECGGDDPCTPTRGGETPRASVEGLSDN